MTRPDINAAGARRITPEFLHAEVPVMRAGREAGGALDAQDPTIFVADTHARVVVPIGRTPGPVALKDEQPASFASSGGQLPHGLTLREDGHFTGATVKACQTSCQVTATVPGNWTASMTVEIAVVGVTELQGTRRLGKASEERLVHACQPFVESLVQAEARRRMGWGSRIEREDLLSEANYGLMRGLLVWDPSAAGASPTSYLGMWITSEMRRNTERLDHDFTVPFDAADRYRKVRAIRARLETQGQPSTDEDVAQASTDDWTVIGVPRGFVQQQGRKTDGGGRSRSGSVALRADQAAEERTMGHRVGATLVRYDAVDDDGERNSHLERATPIDGSLTMTADPAALTTENAAKDALALLLHKTFEMLQLPALQRDIIARRFGLPPHETEDSARSISRQIGVPRDAVGRVLEAFQEEMARKGGAFHAAVARIPADQLDDLSLGWVTAALGAYTPPTGPSAVPPILHEQLSAGPKLPPPPQPPTSAGVLAQFACPFHQRAFTGMYPDAQQVPAHRDCPSCGQASPLIRTLAA